jgi:prevent-host-death family protein
MERQWQLQKAKAHFSDVLKRALKGEPQIVIRRGKEAVAVIAIGNGSRRSSSLSSPGASSA